MYHVHKRVWFDVIKLPEGRNVCEGGGGGGDTSYKYTNFVTCVLDYFERSSLLFQLSTKIESLALSELKEKLVRNDRDKSELSNILIRLGNELRTYDN